MALSKVVELNDGSKITVYAPPAGKIRSLAEKKYPEPEKVIKTSSTVGGGEVSMIIEDDPSYLAAMEQWKKDIDREINELSTLFSLRDEKVPDNWNVEDEYGELIRYSDPTWKPREGKFGKRLDWIEWELLASHGDTMTVEKALMELIGIDLEIISSIEETFRRSVEREITETMASESTA